MNPNQPVRFSVRTITDAITNHGTPTTYTAGDVISEVTTNDFFTFNEVIQRGRSGTIRGAILHSSQNNTSLKLAAELWLFRTTIVEVADNSAFAPTDTEMKTLVGIINFPVLFWYVGTATSGAGGNAMCQGQFDWGDISFTDDGSSQTLYGQLVARNAYAPVASEIYTVDLIIQQD